ncbi:52 kDa repressor of the inhibitor of the protein kinase-like [Aphis craccivora]|uniref:52 kDa repressor of the inhibitor of the protein kinase-like n=1 Tax=Aphis craccivora TaxID=307492 RepID=A0A6G0YDX4_APHCR|nr:52 kDa repressor of the inhibitor of the protein kinase-like [Aphis craccivora]
MDAQKRKIAYEQLFEKYSFFFQLEKLSSIEIREQAKRLQDIYVEDLGSSFPNECVHFKSHMKNLEVDEKPKNIQQMLVFIKNNDFSEMYPYVVIALRMFLCTPCSNCSTERSFSALKRVKSYLRSNIKDEKLNALAILNIENDITKKLNYNNVINIFAAKQARKKMLD